MERVHLMIHGRVQGVFFRANTQRKAVELGLSGWVRNTPDGCVEVEAEGERSELENLVAWCRMGPEGASVGEMEIHWEAAKGMGTGFHVRY